MTITGISGGMNTFAAIKQVNNGNESRVDAASGNRPPPPPQGGNIFTAVTQALSSIGALDSQDASSTGSGSDSGGNSKVVQAFGTFMNDLMGALHQHARAGGAQSSHGPVAQGPSGLPPDPFGPPPGMGQGLQSLSQQHGADQNSATSDSGDTSALRNSFQSLLSAMGVTSSSATLQNFLSALSSNMSGVSASGNVVNTQA